MDHSSEPSQTLSIPRMGIPQSFQPSVLVCHHFVLIKMFSLILKQNFPCCNLCLSASTSLPDRLCSGGQLDSSLTLLSSRLNKPHLSASPSFNMLSKGYQTSMCISSSTYSLSAINHLQVTITAGTRPITPQ